MSAIGVHESTTLSRIATGAIFGFALGIILAPILEELIGGLISRIADLKNDSIFLSADAVHMNGDTAP